MWAATVLGVDAGATAFMLISVVSCGCLARPELAALPNNPSMAGLMGHMSGSWGEPLIRRRACFM